MSADSTSDIKSELENILLEVARSKNIKNYELKPELDVQLGDGFVAHFYRGLIRDKDSGETVHVAIKKAPGHDFDYTTIFKNEIAFYSHIFPALRTFQKTIPLVKPFNNVPEVFCYGIEPKKQYIAMENLKEQGYVLFDKMKYLDKEHLESIFKIYGKFHALSFVLRKQNFEEYQEIHKGFTDILKIFANISGQQFEIALTAAVKGLDKSSNFYEVSHRLAKNVIPTMLKACNYTGKYRCSTHGDCWSNNMLFKYTDSGKLEDVKLIDFQLARDGTPVHDLSYFLYSGGSKTDFDDLEQYLKIYHDSLSEVIKQFGENPEELFSYDTLLTEWKDNALMGIIMGIYLWQIKLIPKKDIVDRLREIRQGTSEEIIEKFRKVMSAELKGDAYRERTGALLMHAHEFGILTHDKIVEKSAESTTAKEVLTTEL